MFSDIMITTKMLYQGALIFALMDIALIPLLVWRINRDTFHRLKWLLVIAAAFAWFGIWSWTVVNFWEDVYSYVFPPWAQALVPWIAFVAAGFVVIGLWTISLRIKGNPVLTYCLLGGILGSLTHIWAVYRGLVTKPPMLQGVSPLAAVVIAFFEYTFYWCVILTAAKLMDWVIIKFRNPPRKS